MKKLDMSAISTVWIIDRLMHLPQTKCVRHKEQCLLLPRLEDSHWRKSVHCSWVSPLFPLRFYSQNFELFITITCKNPAHCRFYWKIPETLYYIPSGMQIECMLYSLRLSALLEKKKSNRKNVTPADQTWVFNHLQNIQKTFIHFPEHDLVQNGN